MKKLKFQIKRIYRLSLNFQKQEEKVWHDLKKLHAEADWDSGIYEKERCIESKFQISEGKVVTFYYMIYDGNFHSRVKILEEFPEYITTDLFILAAHFNNLLKKGVVVVNVNSGYIEYHQKKDLIIPLLYSGEIHRQIIGHYETSKDIHLAFQRLVQEQEAPAIIIADLLKERFSDEKGEN